MANNPNRVTTKKLKAACCKLAARVFAEQDPDIEVFPEGDGSRCLVQVTYDHGKVALFEATGSSEYQGLRQLLGKLAKALDARRKVDAKHVEAAMDVWAAS